MTAVTARQQTGTPHVALPNVAAQLIWYAAGAALAFVVPYVFSSVLDLQHDWYLLAYVATMSAFLGAYIAATRADVVGMFRRSWKLSLAIGVLTSAFVIANVLARETTPRPDGAFLGFELLWRGVTYGAMDALVLTAFPLLVATQLLRGMRRGWGKRVGIAALAAVLMWSITATYHVGYAQYREDGIAQPEIGNTVISIPAIISLNPVGSVMTHAAMHVTAVIHTYETDVFLPPQADVE